MKERPILFSGPMVRAILSGAKTQTRRAIKPQPRPDQGHVLEDSVTYGSVSTGIHCPYGKPGDRLWVRETHWRRGHWEKTTGRTATVKPKWRFIPEDVVIDSRHIIFEEPDEKPPDRTHLGYHKRPSIFLPRWASRITLEVTEVRVERVQDISEEDATAEGVDLGGAKDWGVSNPATGLFMYLWDSINAKRGYGWEANPFVWVVSFKRVDP